MADDRRQRYAEAIAAAFGPSGECRSSNPLHCECGPHAGASARFDRLADAAMAVRDEEVERLRCIADTDSRINFQLREEITRLRINAEKDVCSGCMQREEARDRAMESARQIGVKYEGAKQRWYEQQDRAEDAERERDEWRERAQKAETAVARARALADRWCHEPHPTHDHSCPDDLRRELLAALDDTAGTENG